MDKSLHGCFLTDSIESTNNRGCSRLQSRLCDVDMLPAKATTCIISETKKLSHCSTCSHVIGACMTCCIDKTII